MRRVGASKGDSARRRAVPVPVPVCASSVTARTRLRMPGNCRFPPREPQIPPDSTVVVWLTGFGDLRMDDNASFWLPAAKASKVTFVFASSVLTPTTDAGVAATAREIQMIRSAAAALSRRVKVCGGDMLFAPPGMKAADAISAAVVASGADTVVYHADPANLDDLNEVEERVLASGATPSAWGMTLGDTPVTLDSNPDAPNDFSKFAALARAGGRPPLGNVITPTKAPQSFPPSAVSAKMAAAAGLRPAAPSVTEFLEKFKGARPQSPGWGLPVEASEERAMALLEEFMSLDANTCQQRWLPSGSGGDVDSEEFMGTSQSRGGGSGALNFESVAAARLLAAGGADSLAKGEVFARMFGELLSLGCLSPRRAVLALQARSEAATVPAPAGKLLARLATAAVGIVDASGRSTRDAKAAGEAEAALSFLEASEWHRRLAWSDLSADAIDGERSVLGDKFVYKYMRWRGYLIRYAACPGSRNQNETEMDVQTRPPVVLVHGFGASADQWHKVINRLDASGPVYALDLIGFGHSQKPPLSYTQYLWEQLTVDFARRVSAPHGGKWVVAGNSIGGYTAASAAARAGREECVGLVLLNSAGRMLNPDDEAREREQRGGFTLRSAMAAKGAAVLEPYKPVPRWAIQLGGRALFAYLQPNIGSICRNVYPGNPGAVDARLCENIRRDSNDPGAVNVLASGSKLPQPISKNEVLELYGGRVLVCQGLSDPLGGNQARPRFDLYKNLYERMPSLGDLTAVALEEIGHCPHDEAPERVSDAILEFLCADSGNSGNGLADDDDVRKKFVANGKGSLDTSDTDIPA